MCAIKGYGLDAKQRKLLQRLFDNRGENDFDIAILEGPCTGLNSQPSSFITVWGSDNTKANAEFALTCAMVANTDYDFVNQRGFIPQLPSDASLGWLPSPHTDGLNGGQHTIVLDPICTGVVEVMWTYNILKDPQSWKIADRIWVAVDKDNMPHKGYACCLDRDTLAMQFRGDATIVEAALIAEPDKYALGKYAEPIIRLLAG